MRNFYGNFINGLGAWALLLVRLVMGVALVLHGLPKIQNPTAWMDAAGGGSGVPSFLQALAAFAEFGGGIFLILGLLTQLAALGLVGMMVGALALVHIPQGHPFVAQGGPSFESALLYLVMSIMFMILGPGKLSVDALLFGRRELEVRRPLGERVVAR